MPPRGVVPVRPASGQESVWDYPRPPRVERIDGVHILVELGGVRIAETVRALRVLETSHPPTYYIPMDDFVKGALDSSPGSSHCEFKGKARYLTLVGGKRRESDAAWFYPEPALGYELLLDHVSLYPGRVDCCRVDGEVVVPQDGGFYGGWITSRVVGPFKGVPGSWSW